MKPHLVALAIAFAVAATTAWGPPEAHADSATAQAAFKQAEALAKQGKWTEACPLYEASYNADPQLGALLYVAECHERIGRIASAWAEFNDAIDLARAKSDPREARIRKRADDLLPKLAKLRITPPQPALPGLVVHRGAVDITVLIGTDLPVDPGEHELVASAPGYVAWKTKVTVAPTSVSTVTIPALEKIIEKVDVPLPPVVQEGTLDITTDPAGEITIDSVRVGTGHYTGKVRPGGHMVRIVAAGMRPYQGEVFVSDGEVRTVNLPLEQDAAPATILVAPPRESSPSFELGASLATGVKLRGDEPLIVALRAEVAFRIGRRVNFGAFVEYGSIDTGGACGFDMAGPEPATEFDFGPRNRFTKCTYVMPGLQLYVHVLPGRRWDPYLGIAPGFRFGFTRWTPSLAGMEGDPRNDLFLGIVLGARAGIAFRPKPDVKMWEVGAFIETGFTLIGDEAADQDHDPESFVSVFGGLRTSLAF